MSSIGELGAEDASRVARYYARLADLLDDAPIEPIVNDLLEMLVAISRASIAYVEAPLANDVVYRAAYPRDDIETIGRSISHGIVQMAVAECRTICTPGALTDDRFAHLGSVRQNEIRAVLCSPIKIQGLVGVVYLQGPCELNTFDRELVEGLARKLGRRLAWPITAATETTMEQATEAFKRWFALEVLEQCGWKGTATADALAISRSTLYELVRDLRWRRRVHAG